MTMIISSQRFLDDEIVSEKIASKDFSVSLSPEFEVDGCKYQVVLDGHHGLAAAKQAGVEPEFVEIGEDACDAICILETGNIDQFLLTIWMDSDYYDIATGIRVWQ